MGKYTRGEKIFVAIFIIIPLIILAFLIIDVTIGIKFSSECLKEYAINYCENLSLDFDHYSTFPEYIFACTHLRETELKEFRFSNAELESCRRKN